MKLTKVEQHYLDGWNGELPYFSDNEGIYRQMTETDFKEYVKTMPTLEEIAKEKEDRLEESKRFFVPEYAKERANQYPKIGDQIDALIKAVAKIKTSGVDIGSDATALLETITNIKTSIPKTDEKFVAPDEY